MKAVFGDCTYLIRPSRNRVKWRLSGQTIHPTSCAWHVHFILLTTGEWYHLWLKLPYIVSVPTFQMLCPSPLLWTYSNTVILVGTSRVSIRSVIFNDCIVQSFVPWPSANPLVAVLFLSRSRWPQATTVPAGWMWKMFGSSNWWVGDTVPPKRYSLV